MLTFSPKRHGPTLLLGFALPLLLLFLLRWGFLCVGGEIDPDAYYHIRLAESGPAVFFARTFPQMTLSVWENHFSDKEALFHLILWGVSRLCQLFGVTQTFPFHLQTLLFDALLLAMLLLLLRRWRVPAPWLYPLLLVSLAFTFTVRLLHLRAYLLAMTLFLLTLLLLTSDNLRRRPSLRLACLTALGFLYAWSYSNPHFILIPCAAIAGAEALQRRTTTPLLTLPAAALLGNLLGLLIHPQFPNTFLIFKVQCIDVITMLLNRATPPQLQGGAEFYIRISEVIRTAPLLPCLPLALLLLCRQQMKHENNGIWRQQTTRNALILLSLGTGIPFLFFFRFGEFALLSWTLTLAWLMAEQQRQHPAGDSGKRLALLSYTALSLAILCLHFASLDTYTRKPCYGVAQWAASRNLPPGTVIANIRWGNFPLLYYAMPQFRYLYGLDPMFAYARDPRKTLFIENVRSQRHCPAPAELAAVTGANFLYVHPENAALAETLWQRGYHLEYQGWDGWIFALNRPPLPPSRLDP